ncbi:ATP-binding cassette domain-containing protein [Rubrobacter calidifluminis]|uniref:ATP-binding cassette domain-containing protein n=1 Tax=Rubrobacter calidifluminis TaxID=1392640 RepID=UPI002360AB71|nr:ATP-binding cassette domain-containing protein [Rubrobacter calidifluminis]
MTGGNPEKDPAGIAKEPVLQVRRVSKSFGAVQALRDVDFEVYPDEVVALCGDNGAGKSTLINIITGVFPPDSGEIFFQGERVEFSTPQDARERGIETVYQDLAAAPHLDAVANMFLGREKYRKGILGRLGFLDHKAMRKEAEEQLERLKIRVQDMRKPVSTFSGGMRKGVVVARAAMWASKLIVMDEPTAALGVNQVRVVLDIIRKVRDSGIPVIFISHSLPEVFEVADRIVVLRLGQVAAELDPASCSMDDVVAAMTGSAGGGKVA